MLAWEDKRNLCGLMSQPLYRDGYAYLLDKRYGLTCFEVKTGKKFWDDGNRMTPKGRNPQATLVWHTADPAGDRLAQMPAEPRQPSKKLRRCQSSSSSRSALLNHVL